MIHRCAGDGDIVQENIPFGRYSNSVGICVGDSVLEIEHVCAEKVTIEGESLESFVGKGGEIKILREYHIHIYLLTKGIGK